MIVDSNIKTFNSQLAFFADFATERNQSVSGEFTESATNTICTLTNGASIGSNRLLLDGVDDFVSVPQAWAETLLGKRFFSATVAFKRGNTGVVQDLFRFAVGIIARITVFFNANNTIGVVVRSRIDDPNNLFTTTAYFASTSNVYILTLTIDVELKIIRLYVDGVLVSENLTPNFTSTVFFNNPGDDLPIRIGGSTGGDRFFNGEIYAFIANFDFMDANQVSRNYDALRTRFL
jgi:hypothetical protein